MLDTSIECEKKHFVIILFNMVTFCFCKCNAKFVLFFTWGVFFLIRIYYYLICTL